MSTCVEVVIFDCVGCDDDDDDFSGGEPMLLLLLLVDAAVAAGEFTQISFGATLVFSILLPWVSLACSIDFVLGSLEYCLLLSCRSDRFCALSSICGVIFNSGGGVSLELTDVAGLELFTLPLLLGPLEIECSGAAVIMSLDSACPGEPSERKDSHWPLGSLVLAK